MKSICEGYVFGSRSRKLNENKEPVSEWSEWRFVACHGSGVNPYVYTTKYKAAQRSKVGMTENPIYDYSNRPEFEPAPSRYGTPEYKEWNERRSDWYREVYAPWARNRPIIGYYQYERKVIPAKIMVNEEDLNNG